MTLKFIICGLEHSGTTLLSDVFRQVSGLDAGFEVGVLLGDSPRDFPNIQPFYNNVKSGWNIQISNLEIICDTNNFFDFYVGLQANSGILDKSTQYIFDKTPRYFLDLFGCQKKVKLPFIATYKDPRSLVFSDYKRSGKGKSFKEWYDAYKKTKLQYLTKIYNNSYLVWKNASQDDLSKSKIFCIGLEEICLNTKVSMEKIFQHVGFNFELSFLLLKGLRYQHTRRPEISSRIPFEYLEGLTKDQILCIQEDFAELTDWFYE